MPEDLKNFNICIGTQSMDFGNVIFSITALPFSLISTTLYGPCHLTCPFLPFLFAILGISFRTLSPIFKSIRPVWRLLYALSLRFWVASIFLTTTLLIAFLVAVNDSKMSVPKFDMLSISSSSALVSEVAYGSSDVTVSLSLFGSRPRRIPVGLFPVDP